MSRVKRGNVLKNRHRKILKLAKGFRGSRSKKFTVANQAVMKALKYAYRDRRNKRRDLRRLWITRINAGARLGGLSYSQMMFGLKRANVTVNRKHLADLAVTNKPAFSQFVEVAKKALPA